MTKVTGFEKGKETDVYKQNSENMKAIKLGASNTIRHSMGSFQQHHI